MPELGETGAFDGLDLPLAHGAARLGPLARAAHLIAPLAGQGRRSRRRSARQPCRSAARRICLSAGSSGSGSTSGCCRAFRPPGWPARLTEQSDGWAGLHLTGPDAAGAGQVGAIDLHPPPPSRRGARAHPCSAT